MLSDLRVCSTSSSPMVSKVSAISFVVGFWTRKPGESFIVQASFEILRALCLAVATARMPARVSGRMSGAYVGRGMSGCVLGYIPHRMRAVASAVNGGCGRVRRMLVG